MKIICVNGFPRSGKDEFCKYAHGNRGLVYQMSTIDKVKEMARRIGWNGAKDDKGRRFLSDLKDSLTRYNDFPTQYVLKNIRAKLQLLNDADAEDFKKNTIFLVQMREGKEIERWKRDFGAKSLLIERPYSIKTWGNHADAEVLNCTYDYKLVNSGTLEDLKIKTVNFIDMIRKENWESYIWTV